MRAGADCSICASADHSNEYSDLVATTAFSFIHLNKNQAHRGHCCVIFRRHAPELHDLSAEELLGFTTDVARLGRVLEILFRPVKIDQLIMGHLCPHLHCHVFPQYQDDDPHANPHIHDRTLELGREEQLARVELLRAELARDHWDRVLVGGREKREIVIVGYDRDWPAQFAGERDRMRDALGATAVRIEHIGSTSVPGLAAKPTIDVLVTVTDADDEAAFRGPLEGAGYVLRVREPGHRMFRTPARSVHVHVWGDADPEVERYLRFRDRLRVSASERDEYERLKRDLAEREWPDVNCYAEAKGPFIASILARVEARRSG